MTSMLHIPTAVDLPADSLAMSPVTIKHTFVHVEDPVPQRTVQRRKSVPPSWRVACVELKSCVPRAQGKVSADSDDSGISTIGNDNDISSSDTESTSSESVAFSSLAVSPIPPFEVSERVGVNRTPLNRSTRTWTPLGTVPVDVRHRISRVIVRAKEALAACVLIQRMAMMEDGGVWSLIGYCLPQHRSYAQILLAKARTALLDAVNASHEVCVVGNHAPTSQVTRSGIGISLRLALVEEKCTACWDVLKNGFCPRGQCCQWTHPVWIAPVNIMISFQPSASQGQEPGSTSISFLEEQ